MDASGVYIDLRVSFLGSRVQGAVHQHPEACTTYGISGKGHLAGQGDVVSRFMMRVAGDIFYGL